MRRRQMHDGADDGLEALEALDVRSVNSFSQMLRGMSRTAFGGRALGEAYEVLLAMARDPSCMRVVTVSGAMTAAKMGRLLCEMIECGLADAVVSTGAILAHGLCEALGGVHYKHDPSIGDAQLYERGYNRIYDTLEMETNLDAAAELVQTVLEEMHPTEPAASRQLTRRIGRKLSEDAQMPSILGCAYERDVPVYVPAFTDSELALDMSVHAMARGGSVAGLEELFSVFPPFNPFLDLQDFALRAVEAPHLGIFTIGGGVPRNWAQQVGPFVEILNRRTGRDFPVPRYRFGVRICPEPDHWGGLSGCSYSEGVSWGKFYGPEEGGRFAEVHCDATIAWPLLVRAALEELGHI